MAPSVSKEKIHRLCAEAGFPLLEARDDGKVLVLVPDDLDALPDAETLRHLADQIRRYQYRHVAFSVEPDRH